MGLKADKLMEAPTIIAFSSMPLGGTIRPPYTNVFFRFCSHALAMPEKKHSTYFTLIATFAAHSHLIFVCVWFFIFFYLDTVLLHCEKPAAGTLIGKAWGLQSSDGRQPGCTAASSLVGNYRCKAQASTEVLRITEVITKEPCTEGLYVASQLTVWSWCWQ